MNGRSIYKTLDFDRILVEKEKNSNYPRYNYYKYALFSANDRREIIEVFDKRIDVKSLIDLFRVSKGRIWDADDGSWNSYFNVRVFVQDVIDDNKTTLVCFSNFDGTQRFVYRIKNNDDGMRIYFNKGDDNEGCKIDEVWEKVDDIKLKEDVIYWDEKVKEKLINYVKCEVKGCKLFYWNRDKKDYITGFVCYINGKIKKYTISNEEDKIVVTEDGKEEREPYKIEGSKYRIAHLNDVLYDVSKNKKLEAKKEFVERLIQNKKKKIEKENKLFKGVHLFEKFFKVKKERLEREFLNGVFLKKGVELGKYEQPYLRKIKELKNEGALKDKVNFVVEKLSKLKSKRREKEAFKELKELNKIRRVKCAVEKLSDLKIKKARWGFETLKEANKEANKKVKINNGLDLVTSGVLKDENIKNRKVEFVKKLIKNREEKIKEAIIAKRLKRSDEVSVEVNKRTMACISDKFLFLKYSC